MSRMPTFTQFTLSAIHHQLVPPYEVRQELTWRKYPHAYAFLLPCLCMAYLARRRDTFLLRLLLLPVVIIMTLRCTYSFKNDDPHMAYQAWQRGLLVLATLAKAMDYAFVRNGRFKIGEKELPPLFGAESTHSVPSNEGGLAKTILPRPVFDAFELLCSMRGIGWDFGRHVYVHPLRAHHTSRSAFIRTTLFAIVWNNIVAELCDAIMNLPPGLTTTGGTIFVSHLPPLQRYAFSTVVHLAQGLYISPCMAMLYDVMALFCVVVLGQSPSDWPPYTGSVLRVRSLHDFWGKAWHQGLRYTLIVWGGIPGGWIAGRAGMVFGTFLASGLYHELGLPAAGKPMDHRVIAFFALQAVGVLAEDVYRKVTGRKVGGVLGTAWVVLFTVVLGQKLSTDSWFSRGLGGTVRSPWGNDNVVKVAVRRVAYYLCPSLQAA